MTEEASANEINFQNFVDNKTRELFMQERPDFMTSMKYDFGNHGIGGGKEFFAKLMPADILSAIMSEEATKSYPDDMVRELLVNAKTPEEVKAYVEAATALFKLYDLRDYPAQHRMLQKLVSGDKTVEEIDAIKDKALGIISHRDSAAKITEQDMKKLTAAITEKPASAAFSPKPATELAI